MTVLYVVNFVVVWFAMQGRQTLCSLDFFTQACRIVFVWFACITCTTAA